MRDYVARYRSLGWAPVRISALAKAPPDRDWPERDYPPDAFGEGDNIGIKLGDKSGGLVDVDLDCQEAIELAPKFLPRTATFGRASKPRSHWIYQAPGLKTWKPNRAQIELRSTGLQTVFPPSCHASGEGIEWGDAIPVTAIDPHELRRAFCMLALGTTLARLVPPLQRARGMHDFVLAFAGGLRRSGWDSESALALVEDSIGFAEEHRRRAIVDTFEADEYTGWTTVQDLVGPPDAKLLQRLAEDTSLGFVRMNAAIEVAGATGYVSNDDGNAERLIDWFGETLRYAEGIGWLRWDSTRWKVCDGPWTEASICARAIMDQAAKISGPAGKALAEWGRQSGNAGRVRACLEIASHRPQIRLGVDELDADPWLLNAKNGTIDLRTGELRPHNPKDLITKIVETDYDPKAECPRFNRFVQEVMGGDLNLVGYLLRFLGYGLTGLVHEHKFGLWYGRTGGNGKSTMIELLRYVLGEYATTCDTEALMHTNNAQHPTGLMAFRGARLVFAQEPDEGRRWNEGLIKKLSGGDSIQARLMRQDFVEFKPTHLLIVAANSRPLVKEHGPAFWRRVSLLPWDVSFTGREELHLDRTLRDEAEGVLRYLVAGCAMWRSRGLDPPDQVRDSIEDYRESQDAIGAFLEECFDLDPMGAVPRAEVYARFKMWATQAGEFPLSARAVYRILHERGVAQSKRKGTRIFVGISTKKPLTT